jgi:regulator of extracellular matrix RemA (YlzA/DUF370 family)
MKKITILRKWSNPHIEIRLNSEALEIDMSLEDFLLALTDEVAEPLVKQIVQDAGNPVLLFTNAQLERRLVDAIEGEKAQVVFLAAADRIIEAVKGETSKVM